MITLDEYKDVMGSQLDGRTEEEIHAQFHRDSTFAAFAIKAWLESRKKGENEGLSE